MDKAKEKYLLRNGHGYNYVYKSLHRRDIARNIIKKYRNTGKYKGITEHLFNLVISRIFELKVESLFTTGYVHIGHGFGDIEMVHRDPKNWSYDHHPIDWDKTLDLWLEDPKSKEDKKLVRRLNIIAPVKFRWSRKGKLKNLCYYSFRPSRLLKLKIIEYVSNNKPITFMI